MGKALRTMADQDERIKLTELKDQWNTFCRRLDHDMFFVNNHYVGDVGSM